MSLNDNISREAADRLTPQALDDWHRMTVVRSDANRRFCEQARRGGGSATYYELGSSDGIGRQELDRLLSDPANRRSSNPDRDEATPDQTGGRYRAATKRDRRAADAGLPPTATDGEIELAEQEARRNYVPWVT